MALPAIMRRLFAGNGYGPLLKDDIVSRRISIQDWSSGFDYQTATVVRGSNGRLYWSQAQSGPNTAAGAQDPVADTAGTYWGPLPADVSDIYLKLSGGTMTGNLSQVTAAPLLRLIRATGSSYNSDIRFEDEDGSHIESAIRHNPNGPLELGRAALADGAWFDGAELRLLFGGGFELRSNDGNGTVYKLEGTAGGILTYNGPEPSASDDSKKLATTEWVRDATGNFACNAASSSRLATARKLKVALGSTADATFDGSAAQESIPVSGVLPVANGGTGSTSQNFVDLTSNQSIAGIKTFTAGELNIESSNVPVLNMRNRGSSFSDLRFLSGAGDNYLGNLRAWGTGQIDLGTAYSTAEAWNTGSRLTLQAGGGWSLTAGHYTNKTYSVSQDQYGDLRAVTQNIYLQYQNAAAAHNGIFIVANGASNIDSGFYKEATGNTIIASYANGVINSFIDLNRGNSSISLHPGNNDTYTVFASVQYAAFHPQTNNAMKLGMGSYRWTEVYAVSGSISTSDERLKTPARSVSDEVLDAWGDVSWCQFQMLDAIEKKGAEKARIHSGLIAQRIDEAFKAHGLKASQYGFFCYDEWEAQEWEKKVVDKNVVTEKVKVVDREAVYDDNGELVEPEVFHEEERVVSPEESHYEKRTSPAGNMYSLRYQEALCIEAAYQRRRADRAEARISSLEERLAKMEAKLN